ncbi:unnamed protein product [Didymodactylos carnosus]|uniref:NAD(P)(+)--arginine ADP-ribosyltransferase n=1 Tax=Didymodactylos carnosus TaxID=1234261 RepID=A0A8S2GY57_9BILA|nr:unnamed protein product [Didymodactylos carnosus]CAF3553253.1 unnamed protein product [Didymodactylos carnosus]
MASRAIKAADQLRAQWYWKSSFDPSSTNEKEEWTKYSDIESAIIEEAFNGNNKTKLIELDNYSINLNDSIQISQSDPNNQQQIKRVLISRHENQGLREERFFLPPVLSKTFNTDWSRDAYTFLSQWKKHKKLSDTEIVKQAADGIIIEGKKLGHECESQYIARQLIAVENKGQQEIYKCCIQLYTMECFLYKLINKAIGEDDTSKANTLGPFCYILFRSWLKADTKHSPELYRGANIDQNMLESYKEATGRERYWNGFTSTTRNRQKAQNFGNTLFIINATNNGGLDISPFSNYDEDEVLLPPATVFKIKKLKKTPTQTYIYLKLRNYIDDALLLYGRALGSRRHHDADLDTHLRLLNLNADARTTFYGVNGGARGGGGDGDDGV